MFNLSSDQWQALSPYLDEALGLSDEERSAWLSSLRAANPGLADQIQMLLQELCALSEEDFLGTRPFPLPGSRGLAGQTFGAYTLISEIGQGGMGSVWLAERNDGRFERRVAVKVLNIALIGKGGGERFKREGSILGRLAHPHIAGLFDAGVSPAGQPYLVLEHVDGAHIDRYCDQRSLDVETRVRLFLDVLDAVGHAHTNLIVHRDLKPSNVLIGTDGTAKLLDFGIAKLLEEEQHARPLTLLTGEGVGAMTLAYAAPEQVTGGSVTTATDIYALGVLLYVLLTGEHPAGRGAQSAADLVKAVADTEPPHLSDVVSPAGTEAEVAAANATRRGTTPNKLSRLLRGDLDTIVAKALKKDPRERYTSVSALADDLGRYLKHEPILARSDTVAYRVVKFMRRHRGGVAAALVIVLVTIGAAVVTRLLIRSPESPPQLTQKRLTANAPDSAVLNGAISPDGKYLGYGDRQGIHVQLLETGATQDVPLPAGVQAGAVRWAFGGWFADSTRFLASIAIPGRPVSLWSVVLPGWRSTRLAEVEDMWGETRTSPDGSNIAYIRRGSLYGAREIWLMGSHGESPRKILTAEGEDRFWNTAWSPTGNRIAYSSARWQGDHLTVSVHSCDLSGANKTMILRDDKLSEFMWLTAGRFIYSRRAERSTNESDNLYELRVDETNGTPQGESRRLTDWSGFSVFSFSATRDGKRLAFLRGNLHDSVFVGDLAGNGSALVNRRQLTIDDYSNIPLAWTPDSREVIFSSLRGAARLIYSQALDRSSTPRLITSTPDMNFYLARLSPDGAWLVLEGKPRGARQMSLYRIAISGGVPQLLFPVEGFIQYWCTNKAADFCVYGPASQGHNELVVASFDPLGDRRKELLRIPLEPGSVTGVGGDYAWALSPDGIRIGILKRYGNQVRVVTLEGGQTTWITVKGYASLEDLSWAMDSQSMFVSTGGSGGAKLLHVDLNGNARLIWRPDEAASIWGFSSPDGRHLAISTESLDANMWLLANF